METEDIVKAERDAAKAEIERYKDAAEGNRIRLVHAQNDAERFEAERDAAKAEVARLNVALTKAEQVCAELVGRARHHDNARTEAEAERDAALAAVERLEGLPCR